MTFTRNPTPDEQLKFEENLASNMEFLAETLEVLQTDDERAFATSLIDWYKDKGMLTDKQKFWACKFWTNIQEHTNIIEIRSVSVSKTESSDDVPRLRIDGSRLQAIFRAAQVTIAQPQLKFVVAESRVIEGIDNFQFSVAAEPSKYPGFIFCYVEKIDTLTKVKQLLLLATIKPDATVGFSKVLWGKQGIQQQLKTIIEEPLAAMYKSAEVNNCCVCCNKLINKGTERLRGYHDVCAGRWKLPLTDNRQGKLEV